MLFALALVAAILGLTLLGAQTHAIGRHLPPGPLQLPVIGGLLSWPLREEWLALGRWKERYGSIVHTSIFGRRIIILNSPAVVKDLLEKRGTIYSWRPHTPMLVLSKSDRNVVTAQPGVSHSYMRGWISRCVGARDRVTPNAQCIESASRELVERIFEGKEPLRACVTRAVASIIMQVAYGYHVLDNSQDPMVAAGIEGHHLLVEVWGSRPHLVDCIPWLRFLPEWLPGGSFHAFAKYVRERGHEVAMIPIEWVRQQMEAGTAEPSYVADALSNPALTPDQLEDLAWASVAFFSGGYDTTSSTIMTFFLCMTLFPEAQRKAQTELETVLGTGTLPTLVHRSKLPYMNALVKEVFRWAPVFPMGVPHSPSREDIYEGYVIPKGATVLANVWGILHNEDIYKNPALFDPSRFTDSTNNVPETDPMGFVFGFGRRACPGAILAETNVFIVCATILATMNIHKAKDEFGNDITPVPKFTSGGMSQPLDFPCVVTPRDGLTLRHA